MDLLSSSDLFIIELLPPPIMKNLVFLVATSLLARSCVADCHRHPAPASPYKGLNVTYKKVLPTRDLLASKPIPEIDL
jgi:hypothetical protein